MRFTRFFLSTLLAAVQPQEIAAAPGPRAPAPPHAPGVMAHAFGHRGPGSGGAAGAITNHKIFVSRFFGLVTRS